MIAADTRDATRRRLVAAALATFTAIGGVAFASWQVLEARSDTLYRSEFDQWREVVGGTFGAIVMVALALAALPRHRQLALGVAIGGVVAALAVGVGLMVDLLTSTS